MVGRLLYLDSGNSRLKWRFGESFGVFRAEHELVQFLKQNEIEQVLLASVTDVYTASSVAALVPNIEVRQVAVEDNCLGLQLAYADVSALGVDRWLNMLARVEDSEDVLQIIVSAGTALTVDVVASGRKHLGGYIVPGLQVQARSLSSQTDALPNTDIASKAGLGRTTAQCIGQGILRSCCSLVESIDEQFCNQSRRITITGGDGRYLSESLRIESDYRKNLVFDGMQGYCRQRMFEFR